MRRFDDDDDDARHTLWSQMTPRERRAMIAWSCVWVWCRRFWRGLRRRLF